MKAWNPGKQSLKNSFLRSPLPISRNLPLSKPLPVSVATLLPSELFPKSVPTWRLFLRQNTYAHGPVLLRPTMKVQGRKNLSGFPRPYAISNLYWSSVQMLLLPVKKHPEIRNRYLRLKKRRGHKKTIIAIARMLLTALYHMLKNGENYNTELYRKYDLPPADREITVEQAIIIARNQGYKIKSATA